MRLPRTPEQIRASKAERQKRWRERKALQLEVAESLGVTVEQVPLPPVVRPSKVAAPDLKLIVRDMVALAIENDDIDILNNRDHQGAIKLGLTAQGLIDKQAAKQQQQNFWFGLASAIVGATPELLDDPMVIDGEAREVV